MRLFLAMIVTLVLVLVLHVPGWGCTCAYIGPLEMYEAADAVFTGVVTNKTVVSGSRVTFVDVEIRVTRVWRGIAASTVHVFTSSSDASCGVFFVPAREYLVYAFDDAVDRGWDWSTDLCTRTRPVESAQEDFAALGNPTRSLVNSTWGRIKILYED
jgi:hypothetical protein